MKVIVFGSTGGTGLATCRALAAASHEVTAFARDPARLPAIPSVTPVRGDVMNPTDVAAAMPGHDLVIVSLGNSQNPFARMLGARRTTTANVCEVGTSNIIAAMQNQGVPRLLVVTAFGIGAMRKHLPFAFKLFYWTVLREHMADKEKQEALVKNSGLDWTLVQPVGLTDGPATGKWLANVDGVIRKQQMSRADVAAFLVSLAVENTHSRATVALSGWTADYLAKARATLADARQIASLPLPHVAAREAYLAVFHAAEAVPPELPPTPQGPTEQP